MEISNRIYFAGHMYFDIAAGLPRRYFIDFL